MTHLFDIWPSVSEQLGRADKILLMLDFDGTLAPIVPHPADARVRPAAMSALRALRARPSVEVAIVSGRGASDVRALVGLSGIHYFGSHGRERIRPAGGPIEADDRGRAEIQAICERLAAELGGVVGFAIENKGVSAAAHYRNADARDRGRIGQVVRQAVEAIDRLKVSPGKMVYDITPMDGVDKGTAAMALLRESGGFPLYFGDDTTDENVFRALPSTAVTVFVGPASSNSQARYRVSGPREVSEALSRVLRLARHGS